MHALLMRLSTEKKELILCTDQNIDLLKSSTNKNCQDLLDLMCDKQLLPGITRPTRITKNSATLIDNIYASFSLVKEFQSTILLEDISDHLPCMLMLCKSKRSREPLVIKKRNLCDENVQSIVDDLNSVNWHYLDNIDCDTGFTSFHNKVIEIIDRHSPEYSVKISAKKKIRNPWITVGMRRSSIALSKMYKKTVSLDPSSDLCKNYRTQWNFLNKLIRANKTNYIKNKIALYRDNTKKLWKCINQVIGKNSNKSNCIDYITVDGINKRNPLDLANCFNDYFASIGVKMAGKIPKVNFDPLSCLRKMPRCVNSVVLQEVTRNEIDMLIRKLPNKTSSGYDNISNVFLKRVRHSLLDPLVIIFNRSLLSGIFPSNMKIAEISPLFKSKERYIMNNYRPISLLLVISKILEKIYHSRVSKFMEKYNLFYESQYGFRAHRSTTLANCELVGKIVKASDANQLTGALLIDLSKAFDTIDHDILLKKLDYYGIRGVANDWLRSYLHDRKMYTKVNSTKSGVANCNIGCPQGSILGPWCFCTFINDIHLMLEKTKSIIYADDTTLYYSHHNPNRIIETLQKEAMNLMKWLCTSKLSINLGKTQFILFNLKSKQLGQLMTFKIADVVIERVSFAKCLGLILDDRLNWKENSNALCSKLNSCKYLLNCVKHTLDESELKLLYNAHFQSHLMYGMSLWGPMIDSKDKDRIHKLQKKTIRILTNSKINTHTDPLFQRLHIMKLSELIDLELCKFAHLSNLNILPKSIQKLFPERQRVQNRRITRNMNVSIGKHTDKHYNKSFLVKSISLWLKLPQELRLKTSINSFKNSYKKLHFQ